MWKLAFIFFAILSMLGCQLTPKAPETDWYLRSEFTWWEARKEFILRPIKDTGRLMLTTRLQPDGSPYHLKIADRLWSMGKNCGAKPDTGKAVLGQPVELECDIVTNEILPLQGAIEFLPTLSGTYQFEVLLAEDKPHRLIITYLK
jgi:hypothetical protein